MQYEQIKHQLPWHHWMCHPLCRNIFCQCLYRIPESLVLGCSFSRPCSNPWCSLLSVGSVKVAAIRRSHAVLGSLCSALVVYGRDKHCPDSLDGCRRCGFRCRPTDYWQQTEARCFLRLSYSVTRSCRVAHEAVDRLRVVLSGSCGRDRG